MFKTKIERNGKSFLVSTVNSEFSGWETMVFAMLKDGRPDFHERFSDRYDTSSEAEEGHWRVVQEFVDNS